MTKEFNKTWTKQEVLKSSFLYLLHFLIYLGIAAILLFADKWSDLGNFLSQNGSNYLYAIFCTFLLFVITYLYFFFENRTMLESGKNIALVFIVLDMYLVISCLIGYKIAIYARPVALVALLIFVLIGRREAIFMNVVCAMLIFIIATFAVP